MLRVSVNFIEPTGEVTNYSSSNQANTSRLTKLSVPSTGEKIFYLSEEPNKVTSPLDGQHIWFDETVGYSGWVSNTYSDENGNFTEGSEPTLIITGNNLSQLVLYSDIIEGHYLKEVEVDNMLFQGSGNRLIISLENPSNSITIKIKKVSQPYQPVKITGVELGLLIDFQDGDIIDYNFGGQSQSNVDGIQYGVISRFGNLEIDNSDKLFNNLNDLDILQKTIPIKVYINEKMFGTYLLEDGELQIDASSATFNLTDKLINLDQIAWRAGFYMEYNKTAKEFLDFLINYIGETYVFFDAKTEEIFNTTILAITVVEAANVKQVLNNLCEVTNCALFVNNDGNICIKYLETTYSEVV